MELYYRDFERPSFKLPSGGYLIQYDENAYGKLNHHSNDITDFVVNPEDNLSFCNEAEIIMKICDNAEGYFNFSKHILDIGAHVGTYSMRCPFIGAYAFEPNRETFFLLGTNLILYDKFNNSKVFNELLSDKEEDVMFDGFSGMCDDSDNPYINTNKLEPVKASSLDSHYLTDIGFIKVDVEGMEEKVLRGGVNTIRNNGYPPILFELWDVGYCGMTLEKHDSMVSFLISLGYKIMWYWGDFETHLAVHKSQLKTEKDIKYSVVTAIFDGYEILKDPEEVDPNAEYICVTDNKDLKSNVWQIIYDEELSKMNIKGIQKNFLVKYHKLFDYVSQDTDYVIRLDGSIQIHKSLYDIVKYLRDRSYDCALMLHPERENLLDEYDVWQSLRNQDPIYKQIFLDRMSLEEFDNFDCGLIETTLQIYANNDICRSMVKDIDNMLRSIGYADNNDQCYYTYVYSKYYDKMNTLYVNRQLISSDYMDLCFHYTNEQVYKDHSYATNPGGEFIYNINYRRQHHLFGEYKTVTYF